MRITQKVKKILDWYEGDPPGVKANLARILSTGKLGGTGKVLILPVDQGFEHGPARSFAPNPPAYDPHYHYQLAIEAGEDLLFLLFVVQRDDRRDRVLVVRRAVLVGLRRLAHGVEGRLLLRREDKAHVGVALEAVKVIRTPFPQGDLKAKQEFAAGHCWASIIDFSVGYYAVPLDDESVPYVAFYVEGRSYYVYLEPIQSIYGLSP